MAEKFFSIEGSNGELRTVRFEQVYREDELGKLSFLKVSDRVNELKFLETELYDETQAALDLSNVKLKSFSYYLYVGIYFSALIALAMFAVILGYSPLAEPYSSPMILRFILQSSVMIVFAAWQVRVASKEISQIFAMRLRAVMKIDALDCSLSATTYCFFALLATIVQCLFIRRNPISLNENIRVLLLICNTLFALNILFKTSSAIVCFAGLLVADSKTRRAGVTSKYEPKRTEFLNILKEARDSEYHNNLMSQAGDTKELPISYIEYNDCKKSLQNIELGWADLFKRMDYILSQVSDTKFRTRKIIVSELFNSTVEAAGDWSVDNLKESYGTFEKTKMLNDYFDNPEGREDFFKTHTVVTQSACFSIGDKMHFLNRSELSAADNTGNVTEDETKQPSKV